MVARHPDRLKNIDPLKETPCHASGFVEIRCCYAQLHFLTINRLRPRNATTWHHGDTSTARAIVVYDERPFRPTAFTNTMPRLEFTLTGDYVELHNLLKLMGLADSGGAAKARVAMGEVKVDGQFELRKTCKIRAGQTVLIDNTTIKVRKPATTG